eukprot:scaffold275428_cov27-Tisochrysis_lutea.AAC.4
MGPAAASGSPHQPSSPPAVADDENRGKDKLASQQTRARGQTQGGQGRLRNAPMGATRTRPTCQDSSAHQVAGRLP